VKWVRIESNAVSVKKSDSSSSPDVKTRVSSDPIADEAGSEAAIECRLGRWRTDHRKVKSEVRKNAFWYADSATASDVKGRFP
jgi:hypothetical protein